jgi:hypothetical protein
MHRLQSITHPQVEDAKASLEISRLLTNAVWGNAQSQQTVTGKLGVVLITSLQKYNLQLTLQKYFDLDRIFYTI